MERMKKKRTAYCRSLLFCIFVSKRTGVPPRGRGFFPGEAPRADAVRHSYHRTRPAFLHATQGISPTAKRGYAPNNALTRPNFARRT